MTRDVVAQLRLISGQQSKIRELRNRLAAFTEVLARQEAAFGELRSAHRCVETATCSMVCNYACVSTLVCCGDGVGISRGVS